MKISHHSIASGPLNGGLLYLIICALLVVISPFLLVFYADGVYGQTEAKMLDLTVRHAKEAVLIMHQTDGFKVYSPGVPTITETEDVADCKVAIVQNPSDLSVIKTTFECNVSNVTGFELYSYFDMKMNGYSTANRGFVPQMIMTHASGNAISSRATFYSQVEFLQYRISGQENSYLLPANDVSLSNGLIPSQEGNMWSPDRAISNHTGRNVRFQQTNVQTRWTPGQINKFIVEGNFEFPTVTAQRNVKMWTGIKYGLIQYLAFFFVFAFVFDKMTDFLFESGVFLSFTKIDRIEKAKRG